MSHADAIRLLRSFLPFAALDCAMLKLLAFSSMSLAFEAGETLLSEEDAADSVYLIEEGEADVWAVGDGGETKVATFRRNELVDCAAILRDAGCRSTIRAVGPLKVLKIDADVLLRMVADSPQAALTVMREHRRAHMVGRVP
jgi:CRP/FNR family cyclic AMP-dependent transcriptional regulator